MSLPAQVRSLYQNLLRKPRMEKDLDEELRSALELIAEEKIAAGMSPGQALREARIEMGGVEQMKEQVREARIGASLERLWRDLGYGLRLLRKSPGFAAIVVIILALGIGANTAVFSIIEGAFLDPFPYNASHDIISIWAREGRMWFPLAVQDVLAIRRRVESLKHVNAYIGERHNLTGVGEPVGVQVIRSTEQMFPLLGIEPLLGRVFTKKDVDPDSDRVAVLSHDLWEQRFGGDLGMVGKSIVLSGDHYEVIGIMPPRFLYGDGEIWTPLDMDPERLEGSGLLCHALLREASTVQDLIAELKDISPFGSAYRRLTAIRLIDEVLDDVKPALIVLMAVAGLILLIACANVSGLMMVRSIARAREVAMRVALGAGRARVVRQLLTENALLAVLGGVLGLALAYMGIEVILGLIPADYIPVEARVEVSFTMLALTLGVATLVAVVFGTSSAWRFSSLDIQESLKEGGRRIVGESLGRRRARRVLVVLQVAVTLVLLTSAGLLLNSFIRLRRVNLGFEPKGIVTFDVTLPAGRYAEPRQVIGFFRALMGKIEKVAGVDAVSASNLTPLAIWPFIREVVVDSEGVPGFEVHQAEYRQVTLDYFRTFGISVVEGRAFSSRDSRETPAVVVVNQTFARELLPKGGALGRHIRVEPRKLSAGWLEIVGVVEDVKQHRFHDEVDPEIYQLHTQAPEPMRSLTLSVRSPRPLPDLLTSVQSELRALDPDVPVLGSEPMKTFVDFALGGRRLAVFLTSLFAALGLTLTLVGVYGLIAYRVSQRAQEMSLRMALGATPVQIMHGILKQGLGLVVVGVALGIIGSAVSAHALRNLLFGVKPYDPITLGAVIGIMLLVAALACYVPARRVFRFDPGAMLHYE